MVDIPHTRAHFHEVFAPRTFDILMMNTTHAPSASRVFAMHSVQERRVSEVLNNIWSEH